MEAAAETTSIPTDTPPDRLPIASPHAHLAILDVTGIAFNG